MIHKLWVDGAMELASFQRLIPEYKAYVVDEKDTVSLGIGSVSRCRVVSVTWLFLVSSRCQSRYVSM